MCLCSYSFYYLYLIECRIFRLSVCCHRYYGRISVGRDRLYAVRKMVDCRGCDTNATDDGGYCANATYPSPHSHLILLNLTFAALSSGGVIKCGRGRRDKSVWGVVICHQQGRGGSGKCVYIPILFIIYI